MRLFIFTFFLTVFAATTAIARAKIEVRNAYDESLVTDIEVAIHIPGEGTTSKPVNRRARIRLHYEPGMSVKAKPPNDDYFGRYFPVLENPESRFQTIYIYPTPEYEQALLKEKGCEICDEPQLPNKADENSDEDYPGEKAVFPGGDEKMKDFLVSTIKYPEISMELGDEAKVYIRFIVNKDGSITCAQSLRKGPRAIDAEALHTIRRMPNWEPARKEDGEVVRAYCRIPINFVLQ